MKKALGILCLAVILCGAGTINAFAAGDALIMPIKTVEAAEFYTSGETAIGDLPMASVRSVAIDAAGGMWVGTNGGGLAYKPAASPVFTDYSLQSDKIALQSDVIQSIAVDAVGGIWISQAKSYIDASQNKGVAYYYKGEVTYYNETVPGTIPNNYVQEIKIAPDGTVWFGSFGGLTAYNPQTKYWHTWTIEDGLPAPSVDAIAFDNHGKVWFGCYPGGSGTKDDHFKGGFGFLSADKKVCAWIAEGEYDEKYQTSRLADAWVRDIAADAYGGAWIVLSGSYANMENKGGTVIYIDSQNNLMSYTGKELLGEKLMGNSEIRCVAVDSEETVWFGTWNGVYAYDTKGMDQRCFSAAHGDWHGDAAQNTKLDNVYSLDIINNVMYIGSNGGVAVRPLHLSPVQFKSKGIFMNIATEASSFFSVVNGLSVLLEVPPVVQAVEGGGVTFVPVRFVTEQLGLSNNWTADKPALVELIGKGINIQLTLGSDKVLVNGVQKSMAAAPYISNNRTMVPLRFISECLGFSVDFDINSKDIVIK